MSAAALLAAYKGQPHLERRNHTLKGVLDAAPSNNSDLRIDALAFCLYGALLVHALVERTVRAAMAAAGIDQLPLYHESVPAPPPPPPACSRSSNPCPAPTSPTPGAPSPSSAPTSPLQRQLLDLLDIPLNAYHARCATPSQIRPEGLT